MPDYAYSARKPNGQVLVGYSATRSGKDALKLAVAIAASRKMSLELVMVEPVDSVYSGVYPHDRGYDNIVEKRIADWLQQALESIPEGIEARARIVKGDSEPAALLQAADELDCDLIVVGARRGGLFGRFRIGSVANSLLHSADRPVALAPKGYRFTGPISRITCLFGPRKGNDDVLAFGIQRAEKRKIPLRVISMGFEGAAKESGRSAANGSESARGLGVIREYADGAIAEEMHALVDSEAATVEFSSARSVEKAMEQLTWDSGELVVVGSSRLAAPGRIFMSAVTSRILRSIPVPMLVIPSGYMQVSKGEAGHDE
nr:universal stress protein [Corynebacterium lactis]